MLGKSSYELPTKIVARQETIADPHQGVVILSQIDRDLPTTVNPEAWNFNDLACCPIAEIRLVSLNVTTLPQPFVFRSVIIASAIQ
jgi:hypothetical protein